jgi:hypothetical protein
MKSRTCPSPEVGPALRAPYLTEATVRRDKGFGNCPKVEMNSPKMLQDSDRWRGVNAAKQLSRAILEDA